jgi:hypothetical protein
MTPFIRREPHQVALDVRERRIARERRDLDRDVGDRITAIVEVFFAAITRDNTHGRV